MVASLVGVRAVGPTSWVCELEDAKGKPVITLTSASAEIVPDRKRRYCSGSEKRKNNPKAQFTEANWRKSGTGKELQKELNRRYSVKKRQAKERKQNKAHKRE